MAPDTADAATATRGLPVILACAVLQGWALYGLHHAVTGGHWPATDPAMLLALYAVVVFIPLTLQLLAEHAGHRTLWLVLAVLTVAFLGFGFHDGEFVYSPVGDSKPVQRLPPLLFTILLLWLQVLPFLQGRLAAGRWHCGYPLLFTKAWRNKLVLAEATLFTGLFWLLLFLWQKLFDLLGIGFFRELFEEPIFVYPVTALTFGIALHLIDSVERLTVAILEQLLSVLKWLAVPGGFILVIFSVALAAKLPGLVQTGERAISAQWLLWLVAVVVLLLNAAYRDGSGPPPYPAWLGRALRLAVPLTILVALTALYALALRAGQYGLTVQRVWAFVVAGAALLYAVGYAWAALAGDRWMRGMGRVNVIGSLALMAVLVLSLTPVLSPWRLAANSQYAAALAPAPVVTADANAGAPSYGRDDTPVHYLRFSGGGYGRARLEKLANLEGHPDAARIRRDAAAALAATNEWDSGLADGSEALDGLTIYPAGRTLEPELRAAIEAWAREGRRRWELRSWQPGNGGGAYLDLDGDGTEEFILLFPEGSYLYARDAGGWRQVGTLAGARKWDELLKDLAAGNVSIRTRTWSDVVIGKSRLRVYDEEGGEVPFGDAPAVIE